MKRNILILGLLAVAVLVGIMLLGRTTQIATSAQADITVKSTLIATETLYDFGVVRMKDGNVSHRFRITNPTDKDVIAEYLSTSCKCTTAYIVNDRPQGAFDPEDAGSNGKAEILFKPGETREIDVVFDPNAHGPTGVGPMRRYVTLTDANQGKLQFEVKGVVEP